MTTVACLYGVGGEFTVEHVERWVEQVRRHVPSGTRIACLTDAAERISDDLVDECWQLAPAEIGWGWHRGWTKLALFDSCIQPTLYLDLDVSIVGDLTALLKLAAQRDLVCCRDFWGCDPPSINASVVGWNGDLSYVYREFAADPAAGKVKPSSWPHKLWDDQAWLLTHARCKVETWQDLLPGSVLSYKNEALRGVPLDGAAIVVSHGQPRPWQRPGGADDWLAQQGSKGHG